MKGDRHQAPEPRAKLQKKKISSELLESEGVPLLTSQGQVDPSTPAASKFNGKLEKAEI